MKQVITLILSIKTLFVFAQAPDIEWQTSLGGTKNEFPFCIIATFDNGSITAGNSGSYDGDVTGNHSGGSSDAWVVKLNSQGLVDWKKCFGGTGNDGIESIKQTSDTGYIMAGYTNSTDGNVIGNHGSYDYWIVKLDKNGNLVWQKCLGGTNDDYAHSIISTDDGGYIASGYTQSNNGNVTGNHGGKDYWIVKLDASGNIEWQKCFGGSLDDEAHAIIQSFDLSYLVIGITNSSDKQVEGFHGGEDAWMIKLDLIGDIEWSKCYGGTSYDYGWSILQASDSGYAFTGWTSSTNGDISGNHGTYDYFVIKTDGSGNIEWQKCFGGSNFDWAYSIKQTLDKGYVVAGFSRSNDGNVSGGHGNSSSTGDYWIIKLESSGNLIWQKCLGGYSDDVGQYFDITSDSSYIICGYSFSKDGDITKNNGLSDYWVVKLKPDITLPLSYLSFTATPQQNKILLNWSTVNEINNDYFTIERSNNNKDFVALGTIAANGKGETENNYSYLDNTPLSGTSFYRLKQTDKDGKFSYSGIASVTINKNEALVIYPNPAKDKIYISYTTKKTTVTVKVFNTAGVAETSQVFRICEVCTQPLELNISSLPAGIYNVQVSDGENVQWGRVVKTP